jgi:hypothetical protein
MSTFRNSISSVSALRCFHAQGVAEAGAVSPTIGVTRGHTAIPHALRHTIATRWLERA